MTNQSESSILKFGWIFTHQYNEVREHSHMTSDIFWVFLTYLSTLIIDTLLQKPM